MTRGETAAMMDWPEVRIFHAIGIPSASRPGGHPGARHRAVEAVARVLLAGPDELHRLADLFRDQDRLPHEILEDAAPAEAAAQHHLVDHDLVGRHAGCVRSDGKRGFAVLRGRPDLDPVRRHMRRAVLRLHGGMTEEGHLVVRFDALDRLTEGAVDVAVVATDASVPGAQARMQFLANCVAGNAGVVRKIPGHRQHLCRLFRAPPAVRHDRHRVREFHHAADAFHAGKLGLVDRPQRPLEHRALHDGGVKHAGQMNVDGVDRLARDFVRDVEPPLPGPDQLPGPSDPSTGPVPAVSCRRPPRRRGRRP
jgi:hypothetical protein